MDSQRGLSTAEARARLQTFGPNALPDREARGFWRTVFGLLIEPMILLLLTCVAIYLMLGDIAEGLFLGLSIGVVLALSIAQQRKAERALDALKNLSSPRALVLRDGEQLRIPSVDVVPDDLILLQEGDRVPADGVLLSAVHLFVDESLLTGESAPVRKKISTEGAEKIFSSTLVVKGQGVARVTATGLHTEIGKIGQAIRPPPSEATRLQGEIHRLVRVFGAVGIGTCVLITVVYGLTRNDWPNGILAGLAAAMSLLPEEFPVVLTIFLALGAWRLSKLNVLTRNLAAIENLGSVTALCVDKTGTLTQNRMAVRRIGDASGFFDVTPTDKHDVPEDFHEVLEYGALASHQNPFDPMERAIQEALVRKLGGTEHVHTDWKLIEEYPLSDELLAMSCVWEHRKGEGFVIASKGAPEAVIDLCHLEVPRAEEIRRQAEAMAADGLRVLGVAKASFPSMTLPPHQHEFDFAFLGLVGLEDPLRPEVAKAVDTCRGAGLRVLMITGDYPRTAMKIAQEAGLDVAGGALTGSDLQSLSEPELRERLKTVNIFARTVPEQKLRIVNALKDNGEVVAMTGDGVNDAPSLKWADVGIAMGGRGTDVAREAADLVLLDDRFDSIVLGIERGRVIYSNIVRAMSFIVAVHVPVAGLALMPVLLGWPLLLYPAHIVFLELLIDPACSLVFESREKDVSVMRVPPRKVGQPLFSMRDILSSMVSGGIVFAAIAACAFFLRGRDASENVVRTVCFFALILSNIGLIALFGGESAPPRSLRSLVSRPAVLIAAGILVIWFVIWFFEPSRELFGLSEITLRSLLFGLAVAGVAFGFAKFWRRVSVGPL